MRQSAELQLAAEQLNSNLYRFAGRSLSLPERKPVTLDVAELDRLNEYCGDTIGAVDTVSVGLETDSGASAVIRMLKYGGILRLEYSLLPASPSGLWVCKYTGEGTNVHYNGYDGEHDKIEASHMTVADVIQHRNDEIYLEALDIDFTTATTNEVWSLNQAFAEMP